MNNSQTASGSSKINEKGPKPGTIPLEDDFEKFTINDLTRCFGGIKGGTSKYMRKYGTVVKDGGCLLCGRISEDSGKYVGTLHEAEIDGIKVAAHELCLYFASNLPMSQFAKDCPDSDEWHVFHRFTLKEIGKEARRGTKLGCNFCKKKGATVGCSIPECHMKFHLPCGRENNTFHLFSDDFSSFCQNHIPKAPDEIFSKTNCQIIRRPRLDGSYAAEDCSICTEKIQQKTIMAQIVRTSCCRKNIHGEFVEHNRYYHYDCMMQYALTKGSYAFCCPYTNPENIEQDEHTAKFTEQLTAQGIWIPTRASSIVVEEEPLICHLGTNCKCPDGNAFKEESILEDNKKWEFLNECEHCGSNVHRECAGLPYAVYVDVPEHEDPWICDGCRPVHDRIRAASPDIEIIETVPARTPQRLGRILSNNQEAASCLIVSSTPRSPCRPSFPNTNVNAKLTVGSASKRRLETSVNSPGSAKKRRSELLAEMPDLHDRNPSAETISRFITYLDEQGKSKRGENSTSPAKTT